MKFQSDILLNILFISDAVLFKSDKNFVGNKFQQRDYTGVERRHYGEKGSGIQNLNKTL